MRRFVTIGLLGLLVWLTASPARAQLEFGIDRPHIFSIQPRPYRLGHEFQLGVGVMPMDAFYVGVTFGAGYTYHFTDFWAWEIANFHYSINIDTDLEPSLLEEYGVVPVRGGGERTQLFATSALVIKPLFGKLALLNDTIVHAETSLLIGAGPFQSTSGTGENTYWDPAIAVGAGMRFWYNELLSVRFDIRYYGVLKNVLIRQDDLTRQEEGFESMLLFELSTSINFFSVDEDEEMSEEEGFETDAEAAAAPGEVMP